MVAQPSKPKPPNFLQLRKAFGLQRVNIGSWVTAQEQAQTAPKFYQALLDLQTILDVPKEVISLRSTLSIRYGSGGRRGVSAHYEPDTKTLALAKNAGPGSLAHEWFHALDHYLAQQCFIDPSPYAFASNLWLSEHPAKKHPLIDALFHCFETILLSADRASPSALVSASVAADQSHGTLYFSRPEELCARAFEAFVEDHSIRNTFLVSGSQHSVQAQQGLYPKYAQRGLIHTAFTHYFNWLSHYLKLSV
jgi:hypothetical protein